MKKILFLLPILFIIACGNKGLDKNELRQVLEKRALALSDNGQVQFNKFELKDCKEASKDRFVCVVDLELNQGLEGVPEVEVIKGCKLKIKRDEFGELSIVGQDFFCDSFETDQLSKEYIQHLILETLQETVKHEQPNIKNLAFNEFSLNCNDRETVKRKNCTIDMSIGYVENASSHTIRAEGCSFSFYRRKSGNWVIDGLRRLNLNSMCRSIKPITQ